MPMSASLNMQKVSAFVCGAQKGGTTSLHAHFRDHPDLADPKVKELHFFDNESINWSAPDYGKLHAFFAGAREGGIRYDITPIYMFWPGALERIAAYNPDARLIFLFRDPFERAFSHWAMEWARKAEQLPFADAIRSGRARLAGLPNYARAWRVYSYLERGLYGRQVEHALTIFPQHQLLFLRSEDLRSDHGRVLEKISQFLDLPGFPPSEARNEHVRAEIDYPASPTEDDKHHVAAFVARDLERFARLTGLDISQWPCTLHNF